MNEFIEAIAVCGATLLLMYAAFWRADAWNSKRERDEALERLEKMSGQLWFFENGKLSKRNRKPNRGRWA